MNKIALRVYTEKTNKKKKTNSFPINIPLIHKRVLVFDTETSSDEFQNLKFGSFLIVDDGIEELRALFYHPDNISKKEEKILVKYSKENNIILFTIKEFIEKILYPELLKAKTLCVGFNLPFDLSRLAFHFGAGRFSHKGWFSLQLSEDKFLPRIKIKHIDSTMSFIQFSKTRINNFKGYFLDLKTPSSIFSDNKHINLRKAGEFFGCKCIKTEAETHGKITPDYIKYNLNDVQATYEIYLKILEHYNMYGIKIPITNIYSSASLGKHALRQMGIHPLSHVNTNINAKLKGKLMSAYFGGRCEVKIRKTPIEVSVLDFLSMYPSLTIIMGLWDFIIAKDIKEEDVTNKIIELLKNIKIEDLIKKELWKEFNVLVELKPNKDVLPVRSDYLKDSSIYNVGVNYIEYKDSIYYALPDVISSVLLTGKIPEIKKAIKFIPLNKQDTLNKTPILGIDIDPSKDNFIKILIEKRQEIKQKRDEYQKESEKYKRYDGIQRALKILANSVTYGIFIEIRLSDEENDLTVYSREEFFTKQKLEEEGKFFNPLIAVMQVSGARLLLAMAEKYLENLNSTHAYMDTDGFYVPSTFDKKIRDLFKPLNPYDFDSDFFKIEKENIFFYGISSKRYVLYKLNNKKIEIIEYKLHGLGHLLNPYKKEVEWQKQIWHDILDLHYKNITQQDIINKYSNLYAISKLTVSTPFMFKRFKIYNEGKPLNKQIKPFNFILIGQSNNKEIKPITAFSKDTQSVVHKSFIDYNSGKILNGIKYWKSLSDIIFEYIDHPESKFKNGNETGNMGRRLISDGEIVYIGKETKNIEEQPLELRNPNEYKNIEKIKERILKMTPAEARKLGIKHRSTLKRIKDRIKEGNVNWNTKNVRKLI